MKYMSAAQMNITKARLDQIDYDPICGISARMLDTMLFRSCGMWVLNRLLEETLRSRSLLNARQQSIWLSLTRS